MRHILSQQLYIVRKMMTLIRKEYKKEYKTIAGETGDLKISDIEKFCDYEENTYIDVPEMTQSFFNSLSTKLEDIKNNTIKNIAEEAVINLVFIEDPGYDTHISFDLSFTE